jgi:hypothetical protein
MSGALDLSGVLLQSEGQPEFSVARYFLRQRLCFNTVYVLLHPNTSQDSSVSIVTQLQAGQKTNRTLTPHNCKICFSFRKRPERLWSPPRGSAGIAEPSSRRKASGGVKLPRTRKSGCVPPLPIASRCAQGQLYWSDPNMGGKIRVIIIETDTVQGLPTS